MKGFAGPFVCNAPRFGGVFGGCPRLGGGKLFFGSGMKMCDTFHQLFG